MVKYEIEYYPEVACDDCGRIGVYDVDGQYVCTYCLNACIRAEELFDDGSLQNGFEGELGGLESASEEKPNNQEGNSGVGLLDPKKIREGSSG